MGSGNFYILGILFHSFLNEFFQMNFFLFPNLVQPFEFCPPDGIIHNQKWDLRFRPHNRAYD